MKEQMLLVTHYVVPACADREHDEYLSGGASVEQRGDFPGLQHHTRKKKNNGATTERAEKKRPRRINVRRTSCSARLGILQTNRYSQGQCRGERRGGGQ